jgi:hypothetical protein
MPGGAKSLDRRMKFPDDAITTFPVGASTLAMDVNDDAGCLDARGALAIIASMLAPTGGGIYNQGVIATFMTPSR